MGFPPNKVQPGVITDRQTGSLDQMRMEWVWTDNMDGVRDIEGVEELRMILTEINRLSVTNFYTFQYFLNKI